MVLSLLMLCCRLLCCIIIEKRMKCEGKGNQKSNDRLSIVRLS